MHQALGYRKVTVNGFALWVNPISGRAFPHIRGGADDDGGDDGSGDEPRSFTQAEVDKMVGKARGEAKRSAATELAADLGCTVEEAKAKIEALTAADEATKTETQKALDAAATARTEAEKARSEAAAERFAAKVERKLTAAGVPEKALGRAVRLVALEPDSDDDAIAAEIETLQADVPALFTTETGTPAPGRKAPTPPKPPAGTGGGGKSMADLGREALLAAGIRPRDAA